MKYQYKVVPFIGKVKAGQGAEIAAKQLESVITQNVNAGWEFVELGDVNIEVQPGCAAGLLGQKAAYVTFDQIIFRREPTTESLAKDAAWKKAQFGETE